jgi:hypothetical protein
MECLIIILWQERLNVVEMLVLAHMTYRFNTTQLKSQQADLWIMTSRLKSLKQAHELNKFSKGEVQMTSIYKQWSTSLATLRFHLTPVRIAIIKANNNNKCWRGCGELEPLYRLVGMRISATTLEICMEIPQKAKDNTAIWSTDTAPGHLHKGT